MVANRQAALCCALATSEGVFTRDAVLAGNVWCFARTCSSFAHCWRRSDVKADWAGAIRTKTHHNETMCGQTSSKAAAQGNGVDVSLCFRLTLCGCNVEVAI